MTDQDKDYCPDGDCPNAEDTPCQGCHNRRTIIHRAAQLGVASVAGIGFLGIGRKVEQWIQPDFGPPDDAQIDEMLNETVHPNDPEGWKRAIQEQDREAIRTHVVVSLPKKGLAAAVCSYCYIQKSCWATQACTDLGYKWRQFWRCCCKDPVCNTTCGSWNGVACSSTYCYTSNYHCCPC